MRTKEQIHNEKVQMNLTAYEHYNKIVEITKSHKLKKEADLLLMHTKAIINNLEAAWLKIEENEDKTMEVLQDENRDISVARLWVWGLAIVAGFEAIYIFFKV